MAKREVLVRGRSLKPSGLQPRARRPCASVGREASRLEHEAEASSGTGPGRPGVAEAGCQAQSPSRKSSG